MDACASLSMSLLILKAHPKNVFSAEMLWLVQGQMQFPVLSTQGSKGRIKSFCSYKHHRQRLHRDHGGAGVILLEEGESGA